MRPAVIALFYLAVLAENSLVAGSTDCVDAYHWCKPHDCIFSDLVEFCKQTCGLCTEEPTTRVLEISDEETTTEITEYTAEHTENGEDCVDLYGFCSVHLCHSSGNYCRKTCGLCEAGQPTRRAPESVTVSTSACQDDSKWCPVDSNACTVNVHLCRKTCGLCGETTEVSTEETDYPQEPAGTDASFTGETVPEEESECIDIFSWCQHSHCTVMGTYCRKTCGHCDSEQTPEAVEVAETTEEPSQTNDEIEEETGCSDTHYWCSNTVCKYYGKSCRKSCGLCENTESVPLTTELTTETEAPSECQDEHTYCNVNNCPFYESYSTKCMKTCGFCDETRPTEAAGGDDSEEDGIIPIRRNQTVPQTVCTDNYGWCTESVCEHYEDSCRKSCGLCGAEESTTESIEATSETGAPENASECKNERHDCTEQACEFHETSKQCKKFCGICHLFN